MPDFFVDLNGPAGSGTSPLNTRNTIPNGSPGDFIYFPGGSTQVLNSQVGIVTANITWGSFPTAAGTQATIVSNATNFGLINIDNSGLTTFQDLVFLNFMGMATNGGAITCSVNGTTGRASNLRLLRCTFRRVGWNAIRINGTNTATAASTFESTGCVYDDIGEDCVFGAALDYTFDRNICTRLSMRGSTGDAVGFINGDPVIVRVRGNYIDHRDVDSRQCIIVDTTSGGGHAIIEDNVLLGWGSPSAAPTSHSIIIVTNGARRTIRRNRIFSFGVTFGLNNALDEATDNVIFLGNVSGMGSALAITANGAKFYGNTVVAVAPLPANTPAVVMGSGGGTSTEVRGNLFVNFPRGIQSDIASNPTCSRNGYQNVAAPRIGQSGAFSETGAVEGSDLLLTSDYRPRLGSPLIGAGPHLGYRRDAAGVMRRNPPCIGAYDVATLAPR